MLNRNRNIGQKIAIKFPNRSALVATLFFCVYSHITHNNIITFYIYYPYKRVLVFECLISSPCHGTIKLIKL